MNCFKFGREPETKCVISVVNMCSDEKKSDDKVNLYIYDKKKYAPKMWWEDRKDNVEYVEPIGSTDYCHAYASYITLGSHLFRIGGRYLSYSELKTLEGNPAAFTRKDPRFLDNLAALTHGKNYATRTVDIIDLNSEDNLMVAKKGPEMKFPRLQPHLLILQGNLYVAGGFGPYMDVDKSSEDIALMEVLNTSAEDWFWEAVPNPPPLCVASVDEQPSFNVVTGTAESIGVIIVGIEKPGGYCFYTYQPRTKTWEFKMTYTSTALVGRAMDPLDKRPAVVSGKFMLWLPKRCTLLYVMDLENNNLITIDLFEKKLLPHGKKLSPYSPILVKLEEGKFCVFWTERDGPKYSSGPHTYVDLHASTFTLKERKEGKLHVKRKKCYFSLIPDWKSRSLEEVCIVDIPDSKRHNKEQLWTPFC